MVRLRNLELGDIDAVHALISRRDVVRHMLLPLCSREESEKFLRDSLLESRRIPGDPSSGRLATAHEATSLGSAAWRS
jgi:hypothetical protein